MGALTRLYSANLGQEAVNAFKAGNDVLLIPPDLDIAYRGVLAAVSSGEISQARLDESVLKILKTKASLGLHKARLVDIAALDKTVGTPEHIADGQQIADAGVTLVRQNHAVLPLKKTGTNASGLPYQGGVEVRNRLVVVIFTDDVRLDAGRVLERQIRSRSPDANVIYTDPELAAPMTSNIMTAVQQAEKVVVAVYAAPTAGKVVQTNGGARNSVALPEASADLLHRMLSAKGQKSVVLAVGNPYLARDFPEVQNYLCTFSAAPVSEVSAVKAVFGEMEVHGRLPVTIPGIAARGAGTTELAKKMARK
jgi:beta-N-acetylhexosaminidase